MSNDRKKTKKEIEKSIKEKTEISIQKMQAKNVNDLKTLAEIMKEKP